MQIYNKLRSELSLSQPETEKLKKAFDEYKKLVSPLFFGATNNEDPEIVVGGPCIRYDLNHISLNSIYQTLIPLYVASQLKVPCLIFLGVQEEIILSPKKFLDYKKLAEEFKKIIPIIANRYKVEVKIVDTSSAKYNYLIEQVVRDKKIILDQKESTYLFSILKDRAGKKLHSNLRCIVSSRVVACHTDQLLQQLTGKRHFMIVEDIEQYPCYLFSKKYSLNIPNFFAFLPAPSPDGKSTLFKSKNKPELRICDNETFTINSQDSQSWAKETYELIEKLLNCVQK